MHALHYTHYIKCFTNWVFHSVPGGFDELVKRSFPSVTARGDMKGVKLLLRHYLIEKVSSTFEPRYHSFTFYFCIFSPDANLTPQTISGFSAPPCIKFLRKWVKNSPWFWKQFEQKIFSLISSKLSRNDF